MQMQITKQGKQYLINKKIKSRIALIISLQYICFYLVIIFSLDCC